MAQVVIADASPLIILAQVDGLVWLRELFGYVGITPIVRNEILPGTDKPGERTIQAALDAGILQVCETRWTTTALPTIDEGEASCIGAALALANSHNQCLLLMDERMGRAIATELGIPVVGAAGVIGMAKLQGLIPSASAVFEQLLQTDFRIAADIIRGVRQRVGV